MRGQQQRRNDKACGARALACGVTPRPPATETKAGPACSPCAAAWCRRLRAARCSGSAVHARSVMAPARWALLEGGGLVHAPPPAAAGPACTAEGAKVQRAALREQRQCRTTRQEGVSGSRAVLQGGAAWLRTLATCLQRQQAAPQQPWRCPANAATAAAPLTPPA